MIQADAPPCLVCGTIMLRVFTVKDSPVDLTWGCPTCHAQRHTPAPPAPPAPNPLVMVLVATTKLHKLYCAGENDSMEADIVRDGADSFWCQLSPNEQQVAREFSAALADLE